MAGKNETLWCNTCNSWRNELKRFRKGHFSRWENTDSWEWPNHYEHLIQVYLPPSWTGADINLQDITTACNIWEYCREFNIQKRVIERVRRLRNKYFGHNPDLSVSAAAKAEVFDALKDLLKDPDVSGHVSLAENIRELNRIEQGDQLQGFINIIKNRLDSQDRQIEHSEQNNRELLRDMLFRFETESAHREENHRNALQLMRRNARHPNRFHLTFNIFIVVLVAYILRNIWVEVHDWNGNRTTSTVDDRLSSSGCLSENFSFPFRQDLPLYGYIRDYRPLIGREWLFDSLEQELLASNFTKKGIIAVAEMGYGKSAIVSHLLCAKKTEKGGTLRQQTVAFHVCKYDNPSTRMPERFIRRLVGFLSSKSSEFGGNIAMLDNSSILHDLQKCGNEIEACFDQGLALPLKQIVNVPAVPWIIVIDALDECLDTLSNTNPILDLLSNHVRKWPKWIKLLITSRNITHISNLRKFKTFQLMSKDIRNFNDIKIFIEHMFTERGQSFTEKELSGKVKQLLTRSEGIFMYITHALDYLFDRGKHVIISELPSTLGELYEINFERQFSTPESFHIPKQILEIVCVSIKPLSKTEIVHVLNSNNVTDLENIEKSWGKLSYFLTTDTAVTSLVHQSIYEWLISKDNELFHIAVKMGHSMISKYIFSLIEANKTIDVVGLAIHIAKAEDVSLIKMFVSLQHPEKHFGVVNNSVLHRLIDASYSVEALDLLLYYNNDVDTLNTGGVPPSFVATAKGHLDQLKLLVKKGANVSFTVSRPGAYIAGDTFRQIENIKTKYFCGYNLLHIAAKNDQKEIAQYLLQLHSSLIEARNSVGMRASDIACENGHIHVLQEIVKVNINVMDSTCLYHAAKNYRIDIIEMLIKYGIQVECISDIQSLNTLKKIRDGFFNNVHDTFLDEWWTVFKETALHVAIRHGKETIAKVLIETFPALLECQDALGRTPFLSSIVYNQMEMFKLMFDRIDQDECGKYSMHLKQLPQSHWPETFHDEVCPHGASFAHLAALYDREQMILYVIRSGIVINWNAIDEYGMAPIHYASVKSSFNYLLFCTVWKVKGNIDTEIRTQNGSSAFHLAVLSRSLASFYTLTNKYKNQISDLKDKYNMGIMHYLAIHKFNDASLRNNVNDQGFSITVFKYLVDVCKHNIRDTDVFGRNILHYALRNGHFLIIKYIQNNFRSEFKSMLKTKDADGHTPIRYAIKNIDITKEREMIFPQHCLHYHIFFLQCSQFNDYENIFTSFEFSLILILKDPGLSKFRTEFLDNFNRVILSSPYLTSAVLLFHHEEIEKEHLRHHLMEDIKVPTSLLKYSILSIAYHRPDVLHECGKHRSMSPMHAMVLNVERKKSIFNLYNINVFINQVFGNPTNYSALSCADKSGLNIFHYALLGGNICTANLLIRQKVDVANKYISVTDIPMLALSTKQIKDHFNFELCLENLVFSFSGKMEQFKATDAFLSRFIFYYKPKFRRSDFCKRQPKYVSLVHLLAANGMEKTLRTVSDMFGVNTLKCENVDGLTPLYLAKLFNQQKIVELLEETDTLHLPTSLTEEHLFIKLLHEFPLRRNIKDPRFCLTENKINRFTSNILTRTHLLRCISKLRLLNISDKYTDATSLELDQIKTTTYSLWLSFSHADTWLSILSVSKQVPTFSDQDKAVCERFVLLLQRSRNVLFIIGLPLPGLKQSLKIKQMYTTILSVFDDEILNNITECSVSKFQNIRLRRIYNIVEIFINEILFEIKNGYVHSHLLSKKKRRMRLETGYDFASERMRSLNFTTNSVFTYRSDILSQQVSLSLDHFRYLDVFRKMLIYKDFREMIFPSLFGTSKVIVGVVPKEPFGDLTNLKELP